MPQSSIFNPPGREIALRFRSGNSFYTVYNDGWVEQGNRVGTTVGLTVTLPVAMLDANYSVLLMHEYSVASSSNYTYYYSRTATTFRIVNNTDLVACAYVVRGYASSAAMIALGLPDPY